MPPSHTGEHRRKVERRRKVLARFGIDATVPALGCGGMAGMFGCDAGLSERIFDMSWRPILDGADPARILATGLSRGCRNERFAGLRPSLAIQAIATKLAGHAA